MKLPEQKSFFIGDWRVSPAEGVLSRGEEDIHLEPKVAEVLTYLAAHAGEVVTREDLEREVWHGALVGYDSVTNTVIKLRRALHDNSRQPRFISTIPKRGYELIAPVHFPQPTGDSNKKRAQPGTLPANDARRTRSHLLRNYRVFGIFLISFLALIFLGLWTWARISPMSGGVATIPSPSIMVLPFENLNHDPQQDFLVDGMTEDLITDLSRTAQLKVLSNNTSYLYRGRRISPQELGKTLHIDFVLQGSIRSLGKSIRVNAQLVDARTGFNKWGESYDRSTGEVFIVQHEITAGVVNALSLTLTDAEKTRLARKATSNLIAYGYFQEGQSLSKTRTKEDHMRAKEAYRQAIKTDPSYGRAYGALAFLLGVEYLRGWTDTPNENLDRALELAKRAVAMDNSIPQTYWSLGWVHLLRKEQDAAERAASRAIKIAPNYADGYGLLALIENYRGNPRRALEYIKKGMQLNPYYTWDYPYNQGRAYYALGQYDKAISAFEDARERNPNILFATLFLTSSYLRVGRQADAEWMVQELEAKDPPVTISHIRKTMPTTDMKVKSELLSDLRKAGLPE